MLKHSNAFKMRTARKNPWTAPLILFVLAAALTVQYAVRPAVAHAQKLEESYGRR